MSVFVLVHGAWHGAWCWERVASRLRAAGHRVEALDLPGHGDDTTPPADVTLERYADAIRERLEKCREPAVLVGHSMGGVAITQAAERAPERVARLVYLCAFLPRSGESVLSIAGGYSDTLLGRSLRPSADGSTLSVDPGVVDRVFYGDCEAEVARRARERLRPDPFAPLGTPVATSPGRFGRVPRVYLECLRDAAVPLELQRAMYAAQPCERVEALDSGHSPFLSMPEALAQLLRSL